MHPKKQIFYKIGLAFAEKPHTPGSGQYIAILLIILA